MWRWYRSLYFSKFQWPSANWEWIVLKQNLHRNLILRFQYQSSLTSQFSALLVPPTTKIKQKQNMLFSSSPPIYFLSLHMQFLIESRAWFLWTLKVLQCLGRGHPEISVKSSPVQRTKENIRNYLVSSPSTPPSMQSKHYPLDHLHHHHHLAWRWFMVVTSVVTCLCVRFF